MNLGQKKRLALKFIRLRYNRVKKDKLNFVENMKKGQKILR